jgi:hypothetical protein
LLARITQTGCCGSTRPQSGLFGAFDAGDLHHYSAGERATLDDVQRAAGHAEPGTTKLYDRRGYNPEELASFFATF